MRYSEIIIYRKSDDGKKLDAYRVSEAHGYLNVNRVEFGPLFKGHAAWVADQVNPLRGPGRDNYRPRAEIMRQSILRGGASTGR